MYVSRPQSNTRTCDDIDCVSRHAHRLRLGIPSHMIQINWERGKQKHAVIVNTQVQSDVEYVAIELGLTKYWLSYPKKINDILIIKDYSLLCPEGNIFYGPKGEVPHMTVADAYALIADKKGRFFTVTFRRKTAKFEVINGKRTKVADKGDLRTMLCRRGVKQFTNTALGFKGKVKNTDWEDLRNDTLTVFDVGLYNAYRAGGLRAVTAGRRAYRKINLREIVSVS